MKGSQQVTAKDIAELCGVSVTTVSRVINRNGRYSSETEQRVLDAVKKLNYQPNLLAKGLRTRKADAVGVIVPSIANEFFSSMILALQTKLFKAGYAINIYNTNSSLDIERQCVAQLAAQNVGGVISINSREDVREALERVVPTVYVDRFIADPMSDKVASISSDNIRSGALAAQELKRSGCMRPAVITATHESPVTAMRTQGFTQECTRLGLDLPDESIITPPATTYDEGYKGVEKLLSSGTEFDGLFCQTDIMAIGALEALRDHHIDVPDEVAVVGHDDIMISRFGRPPLTTIHQDSVQIGEKAAELMLDMMAGNDVEEQNVVVPVGLIRRESTRRA